MERKGFLTAAMGVATALAATGLAAAAAAPPVVVPPPTMAPRPGPGPSRHWERGSKGSDRNIARVRHHLEKVIDELQHDQHDYHGHRETALDLLHQARQQLLAAEQYDAKHPDNGPTARPF